MSHSPTLHPFQNLVEDCKHVVFSYVLHSVHSNQFQPISRSLASSSNSSPDSTFLALYMCNFEFFIYVNVGQYLAPLFGIYERFVPGDVKRLYYVDVTQNETLTNATYAYFRGCHELWMNGCMQKTVGNEAFGHLESVRVLHMEGCSQDTITEQAFANLRNLHTLNAMRCYNITTTCIQRVGATLRHLNLSGCVQRGITDEIFLHLGSALEVDISYCTQLTGRHLERLKNIQCLRVMGCSERLLKRALQILDRDQICWEQEGRVRMTNVFI